MIARTLIIALALFAAFQVYSTVVPAVNAAQAKVAKALCSTDTECMKLCPKSDRTCDGGPQR